MSLALVAIVRDEEKWVGDCIDSVLPYGLDYWCIADTGSEDGTKAVIEKRLKKVPGELFDMEWAGYGPCRSEVLQRVRKHPTDLILMLDADMKLHGEMPKPPYADAYMVDIRSRNWSVPLPLLTRGDISWCYQGPTHSYLAREDGGDWSEAECELWVEDPRAGGWRPGKLEEDAKLLAEALERNPDDSRSCYYLAQSYFDLGRPADAIREYGRRMRMGGYPEERYVAALRRARLLEVRDPMLGFASLLEAWQIRPQRVEALFYATRFAREKGWNDLALMCARRGAQIERPKDHLCVEEEPYRFRMRLELGIAEVRAGDPSVGAEILRTLRKEELNEAIHEWIDEILTNEIAA